MSPGRTTSGRAAMAIRSSAGLFLAALFGWTAAPAADAPAPASKPSDSALASLFSDQVLVRGKDLEIKRSQLDESFVAYKANLAARGERVPEVQRTQREAQLLDRLIVTQLLINRATEDDRQKAKELGEKFLTESKRAAGSDEAFQRHVKALGLSPETFQARVTEQALSEAVLARELKSKLIVLDAEAEEFYQTGTDLLVKAMQEDLERLAKDPDTPAERLAEVKARIDALKKANLERLEQPERVRVSHVLISTRVPDRDEYLPEDQRALKRQQAEKVLARARAGENFTNLVKEFSEDRRLKETSGEYTFSRDDRFAPEFKAASFSLEPGQISDLVTTMFGHHIIKLLEKIPPRKIELEKAKADIQEFLLQQELQKQMPVYFARLKRDAGVEILDEKYNAELAKPGRAAEGVKTPF